MADRLAAARRGGGDKRGEIAAFAGRLENAIGAGARWTATAGNKCPDNRLREIVPAEIAKRPPGYLAGGDPNAKTRAPMAILLGLRSVPNERTIEMVGLDRVWAEAQQVSRGGIVLVFAEGSSEDSTVPSLRGRPRQRHGPGPDPPAPTSMRGGREELVH